MENAGLLLTEMDKVLAPFGMVIVPDKLALPVIFISVLPER